MKLILPDGKVLEVADGIRGRDAAKAIAISLEKKALAFSFEGDLMDLDAVIPGDGHLPSLPTNRPKPRIY